MAGGRPEYLPILIAAIQAIIDPVVMHQVFNATTCSVYPALIVNGPVAKQSVLAQAMAALALTRSTRPVGLLDGQSD